VILVALTSVQVAYAALTAPQPPPLCSEVPSAHLMGVRIRLWPFGPVTTRVPVNSFSFVWGGTYLDKWSTRTAAEKRTLYASGSTFKLWVDHKQIPLSMDICYYPAYDEVDKMFYVQFFPYQWKGSHTFYGYWSCLTGTEPKRTTNTVIINFYIPQ